MLACIFMGFTRCVCLSLSPFALGGVIDLDWSGDRLLASGSIDGAVIIRDAKDGSLIQVPRETAAAANKPSSHAVADAASEKHEVAEGDTAAAPATAEVATLRWNAAGRLLAIVDSSSVVEVSSSNSKGGVFHCLSVWDFVPAPAYGVCICPHLSRCLLRTPRLSQCLTIPTAVDNPSPDIDISPHLLTAFGMALESTPFVVCGRLWFEMCLWIVRLEQGSA